MTPMYLGVRAVFARSFARIHRANLFNFGIAPFTIDEETYDRIDQDDHIEVLDDVRDGVLSGQEEFAIRVNDDWETTVELNASQRERDMLAEGGKLAWTKQHAGGDADGSAAAD
jgi:aconitate hydratase